MKNPKLTPITRINKWFSQEDFQLEISMGREFNEGDQNFTVILYRVDRANTQYDKLYGEASLNGIRYLAPIELKVIPIMAEATNEPYNANAGTARNYQDGPLTFGVYQAALDDQKVDISYGDYIGYPVTETDIRYFSVANDGKKNYNNAHTIMGYKGAFRTVVCAPADNSEFSAI